MNTILGLNQTPYNKSMWKGVTIHPHINKNMWMFSYKPFCACFSTHSSSQPRTFCYCNRSRLSRSTTFLNTVYVRPSTKGKCDLSGDSKLYVVGSGLKCRLDSSCRDTKQLFRCFRKISKSDY